VAGATLGALLAHDVLLTGAFFCLSAAPLAIKASRVNDVALKRAARFLLYSSVIPFAVACVASVGLAWFAGARRPSDLMSFHHAGLLARHESWVAALFIIAVAARMGVVPFHLWVPVVTERARPTVAIATIVSPIGAITLVRVVSEICPDGLARAGLLVLPFAALSAAYGAVLAVGQHQGQRQLGYIWTSLMGTVLAGLLAGSDEGVTGALLHQLAVALSATGLALHLRSVAARTGTIDLRQLGGLVQTAPGLATGYLLLSLATVAFPSTATFMSEDLLIKGLLKEHPAVAAVLLIATALNGLTLFRTWKRIFLGPPSTYALDLGRVPDVQPRERWTAVALMFALLAGGLGPTPLLLLRAGLRARAAPTATQAGPQVTPH
jgi:NADH-quinone oxidoreductase subunit M